MPSLREATYDHIVCIRRTSMHALMVYAFAEKHGGYACLSGLRSRFESRALLPRRRYNPRRELDFTGARRLYCMPYIVRGYRATVDSQTSLLASLPRDIAGEMRWENETPMGKYPRRFALSTPSASTAHF